MCEASCSQTVKWPDTFGTFWNNSPPELLIPIGYCGLKSRSVRIEVFAGQCSSFASSAAAFSAGCRRLGLLLPSTKARNFRAEKGLVKFWWHNVTWAQMVVSYGFSDSSYRRAWQGKSMEIHFFSGLWSSQTTQRSKASSLWLHQRLFGHSSRTPTNAGSSLCSLASKQALKGFCLSCRSKAKV